MTETATATPEGQTAIDETSSKEAIAAKIDELVMEKTGKRIGMMSAKKVFDTVVEMMFQSAVKDKYFRFPAGFGAFHVKKLGEGTKPRRLPSGQEVTLGPNRVKLRYMEGTSVKELLGTSKKPAAAKTTA